MKHANGKHLYRTLSEGTHIFKPDLYDHILNSVEYQVWLLSEQYKQDEYYSEAVVFWNKPLEDIMKGVNDGM